jgi:hypothetical protein
MTDYIRRQIHELRLEIAQRERELTALKAALAALQGEAP